MSELNAVPTKEELLIVRGDLDDYKGDRTLDSYITDSFAECKRILEDERSVVWSRVFDTDTDAYWDNSDATGRNEDRIKNAISHMAAALIFWDYSVRQELEESWTSLASYHEQKAMDRLLKSTLDIDRDDSGTISTDEEGDSGQVFLVR